MTSYYYPYGEGEENNQPDQPSSEQSPSPTIAPPGGAEISGGGTGYHFGGFGSMPSSAAYPIDPGPFDPTDDDGGTSGDGGGTFGPGDGGWSPPNWPPPNWPPDFPDDGGGSDRRSPGSFGTPYDFSFPQAPTLPGGPSAPALGPLSGQMQGFASNALQNPSRFDMGLVQRIGDTIDRELGRGQDQAFSRLDERMANRGLVGSNVEAETGRRLADDFETQRMQRLNQLEMELARTAAQDRQSAANIGLGVNQQTFGQGMQRAQFGEGQRRFDFGAQLDRRAQELQAQGMEADEAFRRAQLEFESGFGRDRLAMEERLRTRDQRLRQLNDLLRVLGITGLDSDAFEDIQGQF